MRKLYPLFIFLLFLISAPTSAQTCDTNWLRMPNTLSGVVVGDLDIPGNQVTIEAFCNATGDITRALVSKHKDPRDVNYFLCPDLAQITTTDGFFSVVTPCTYVNNKTYHVALVYDGSTLKLYRNGFLMALTAATGNLIQNEWPTTIGEQSYAMEIGNAGISNIFKGVINEVRIWNVARTQEQLQTFINVPLPSPSTQFGLKGYYVFNSLTNLQGTAAFNGTLRGAATINNVNPDCNFIIDSCGITSGNCSNWLSTPAQGSVVDIGELDIPGTSITVEATFNRTTPYTGGILWAGDLVSKLNGPENCNYLLRPNTAEITTSNGYFRTPDICEIELNKTYHAAMVYDGNTLKFYRDGFLMSQVAATGNLFQNNLNTTIGWYAPAFWNTQFIGYINEVRIWNTVRTQAQIQTYMNSSLPNPTTQTGLLAYYTFDDLQNKQGNAAYNGTLGGSASINQINPQCALVLDSCNIVTPVTITAFNSVIKNNKDIELTWHTEEEYGIVKYILQRSLSSQTGFEMIGTINANAGSRNNNYSFTDKNVRPNTRYYYRLLIVENTGASKYSPVRTERISTKSLYTDLYPNPTSGNVVLAVKNYDGIAHLNVFNNLGQPVLAKTVVINNSSNIELRLAHLPKGSYWLQIVSGNERTAKKIVKL